MDGEEQIRKYEVLMLTRDRRLTNAKRYRENNRDRINEYSRGYYMKNKEKKLLYIKKRKKQKRSNPRF